MPKIEDFEPSGLGGIGQNVEQPTGGITSNRFSAAIDQYQAGLLGVGEAVTGALGITSAEKALAERRLANEYEAEKSLHRARELGAVESYKDVHNISDAGSYIAGLAIQSAPYAAEAVAGGLGARALMGGTRAALAASAGDVAAEAAARTALSRGSQVGAATASYPSAVGDVLQNQREQSGKTDLASAAGLAVPYAALNVLGVEGTLAKGELFRSAGSLLDDVSGVKGGLLRAGATGVKTGAGESVSETAQEGLNQLGRMAVDPNEKFLSPEAIERYKESAVGGFVLGGAAGSIGGGWRRSEGSLLKDSTDSGNLDVSNKPDNNAIHNAISEEGTALPSTSTQVEQVRQQEAQLEQARIQAQQEAAAVAAQQAQAKAEEAKQAFNQAAVTYGVKPLEVANNFEIGGKRLFSIPQAQSFVQELDKLNQGKSLEQKALIGAALESGSVKVAQTANPKAINNAAIKFLDSWGFGDAMDKTEAATRAETLIKSLEGPKALKEAEQLNNFYKAVTGVNSPEFEKLQALAAEQPKLTKAAQPKQGVSNERLQLQQQGNAGLREVPVQGGTTQTSGTGTGNVRPAGVQPIGAGSVGTGSPSVQAGAIPSGGVPTSTGTDVSGRTLPSGQQEAQVISDERVDAINQIENIAKRAFGERDYKIIMEFIQSDAAVNQSEIARQFGISRQRVNQIVGAAKEGESFSETIERRAQESWGPRFLLAGRNMGYTQDEVRGLFEVIQKAQDETSLAAAQQAQALSEGATEEELQGKEATEGSLETEEERIGSMEETIPEDFEGTLGFEDTNKTEKENLGYRVFTPGESGETGIEGASSKNRARFSKKALKDMSDEQLQNIAADEETTEERLDDVINEMLRRQEIRVNKGKPNANEKPSAEKQAVGNKPAVSEGIREQDTEERKATRESKAEEKLSKETQSRIVSGVYNLDLDMRDMWATQLERKLEKNGSLSWKDIPEELNKALDTIAFAGVKEGLVTNPQQVIDLIRGKAEEKVATDEEAAAEAWNEGIKDFPDAPKFADLTEEQQEDWISYGEENWTKDDVQTELVKLAKKYSLFNRAPKGAWSADKLKAQLKNVFGTDEAFDELITVINDIKDLPKKIQEDIAKEVQGEVVIGGFVENGHIYLLANNIKQGEELAVLLHELGAHIGLEKLIGSENYQKLAAQIDRWATGKGTPIEVEIAKKAKQRVQEHLEAAPEAQVHERDELIAYFVEEAILAGINPTAASVKGAGQIIQFLRRLVAAMKVALRKIGFDRFEDLTTQNVIDLAFGAAKLELDGVYHGTSREFRKFNDSYITNFMNGWGHYTSNLPAESDTYGKNTIRAIPLVDRKDLIQNDRPMGDQPRIMKMLDRVINQSTAQAKALKNYLANESVENIDGGDFQQVLGNYEVMSQGGLFRMLSKANQAKVVEVEEIVSKFLEQAGILGSTFKPYGRGMPNRQTIMFGGRNLSRISQITETGKLKFSLAKAREESIKQINKLPESVKSPLMHTIDNIFDFAKKGLLAFAFTEDLAKMASKYIKSATEYVDLMKRRQAIRTAYEVNIDRILKAYDKLPKAVKGIGEKSVNKFLKDSTMGGKWAYNPGWIKNFDETKDIDPDMKARFEAMPQEAQEVIKSVFSHGQTTLQAMKKSVMENTHTEYDALIAVAKQAGNAKEEAELIKSKKELLTEYTTLLNINHNKPYAPLKRFGNYVVVGKSQMFIDNEAIANSKTAAPDIVATARAKLRELEKNEQHYFVRFAETAGEANAMIRENVGKHDYIEYFEKDNTKNAGGFDINDLVNRLRNMVDDTGNASEASTKALNRMVTDLRLTLLAEYSARQSERQRRNIAGAEEDMMRSFATQGRATASFISSLENSAQIYETLRKMREEADAYEGHGTRAERRRYYNEFVKRHFMSLDYQPSPFIDKALSTTSMWMLLTNPAYYLQNMTQPFMMSLPVIGARYGYARSWKEMTRAYNDIASVISKHGLSAHSYEKLPADVQKVIEELVNRGRIDISLEQEIGRWRSAEDSKLEKFGRASEALRGIAQDIETINRVATAVAAYRMAIKENKGSPQSAINFADKVIYDTHGDYTGFNAPRFMRTSVGRVATQFRKFQLIQISLMAKLFNEAFRHEDADTRLVGKKALAYTLGHTAIMGGIMGMPGFALASALYGMLFGDEDEPDNPELALRRAIGDDTIADLLVKGVPAMMGVDVSGKLGMGQMLSVLPYTDVTLSRKGVYEAAGTLLTGPFGGLMAKSAEGLGYIGRGDYYKGMEQLVPSGLANAMKGYRYAAEGVTSKTGDTTMSADEIGFLDAFMVALGLPTKVITDKQFLQNAKFEYDQFYNERTSELKREYVRAYADGDATARGEVMDEWKKLQESRMKNGYTRQPMSTLLKAPQEKAKRERNTIGGVAVTKANRGFVKQTSEL